MNRTREDEWPIHPPVPSHSPTSTPQKTDTYVPVYPHPQPGNDNQLPPIRKLVPNLWEPGTSRQLITPDEGKNGTSVYRLRPVGPAWNGNPTNTNEVIHIPRPQSETDHHVNESDRDDSRQVNESNKRPPPSPIERADHTRTAPLNGTVNSNRGTTSPTHKPPQKSNQIGEKPGIRSRSNSGTPQPIVGSPGSGSHSSHHQELLRDPVGKH